jgi:hypothetical protein
MSNKIKKEGFVSNEAFPKDNERIDYKFFFFNSFTAKSAARAVRAMYVSEGFTQDAETIAEPSVTKTFFAPQTWLLPFKTEVYGSRPMRAVPIS